MATREKQKFKSNKRKEKQTNIIQNGDTILWRQGGWRVERVNNDRSISFKKNIFEVEIGSRRDSHDFSYVYL
jgi:hypothetical protein